MAYEIEKSDNLHISGWPEELRSFDERDVTWCYGFYFVIVSDKNTHEKEVDLVEHFRREIDSERRSIVGTSCEEAAEKFYTKVLALKKANVVDLSWIDKNDLRMLYWLLLKGQSFVKGYQPNNDAAIFKTPSIINNLSLYDAIIHNLDSIKFLPNGSNEKQLQLDLLQQYWLKTKMPVKKEKWIDPENSDQLAWIFEYIGKRGNLTFYGLLPDSIAGYHSLILAHFDAMGYFYSLHHQDFSIRDAFLFKIKAAWSQQKFRDAGKTKKAYHLPLTKATHTQLTQLAALSNKSDSEFLERLIDTEYRKVALDENGKEKYARLS